MGSARHAASRGTLVALEVPGDARVAEDRGIRRRPGAEDLVAERVVEMRVRVHHPAHRPVESRREVGEDLLGLGGLGARVDDEQPVVALDHDDREVERPAPALVDAVRDPGPRGHPPSLAMRRERNPVASEGIPRLRP